MSESSGKPTRDSTVKAEPFMAVDRITQEIITQQLTAALEQLDVIAGAIREDEAGTSISLVYVGTINARALVEGALKQLPWAPLPADARRRAVIAPPPPDRDAGGTP